MIALSDYEALLEQHHRLFDKCQRQGKQIRGLRKALRQLEKRHGYAALRDRVKSQVEVELP